MTLDVECRCEKEVDGTCSGLLPAFWHFEALENAKPTRAR